MATLYEVLKRERAQLLAHDAETLGRITRAYGVAYQAILKELQALMLAMATAEASGEKVDANWLYRRDRLQTIQAQAARSIDEFSQGADLTILNGQASAVKLAIAHSAELMTAGAATAALRAPSQAAVTMVFNRINENALQHLVGFLSDGSPLSELLGTYPAQAAMAVEEGLLEGIALGRSPRETARLMGNAMAEGGMLPKGGPNEVTERMRQIQIRALRTARTETLRAYRTATDENYNANSDVLAGWMWLSTRSTRTCPMCWAMHGTIHPLGELMATHIACRCTQVPVFRPEYGGPPAIKTGEAEFAQLSKADQRFVLGKAKFEAYEKGELKLSDLVQRTEGDKWGAGRQEASIKAAFENAQDRLSGQPKLPMAVQPVGPKDGFSRAWRMDRKTKALLSGEKQVQSLLTDAEFADEAAKLFTQVVTPADLASIVGAPVGTLTRVDGLSGGGIRVEVTDQNKDFIMTRSFRKQAGETIVHHDLFEKGDYPDGTGSRIFAKQVAEYQRIGVSRIETMAAGSHGHSQYNGYYTWPRLGFNFEFNDYLRARLESAGFYAGDINELFANYGDEAREWWRLHGEDEHMEFDLTADSDSLKRHQRYIEGRGIRV